MIGYVAKDKNGEVYLHGNPPEYEEDYDGWFSEPDMLNITNEFSEFDNLTYKDKPVKVEIKLEKV